MSLSRNGSGARSRSVSSQGASWLCRVTPRPCRIWRKTGEKASSPGWARSGSGRIQFRRSFFKTGRIIAWICDSCVSELSTDNHPHRCGKRRAEFLLVARRSAWEAHRRRSTLFVVDGLVRYPDHARAQPGGVDEPEAHLLGQPIEQAQTGAHHDRTDVKAHLIEKSFRKQGAHESRAPSHQDHLACLPLEVVDLLSEITGKQM